MYAMLVRHVFAGIFSFLLTYYLIPILARAAKRMGFLDQPDGKIKVHKEAIPYLGGIAIFISFVASLGTAYPFENKVLWLLSGTTLLVFVGFIDDLHVLKPGQKFFGQILAVLCFLKGGFSLKNTFFSSWWNMALSAFWMLSVINAFNLVDVMDGLSSTIALVAGLSFFAIALMMGQYAVSLLLIAFLGAVFAFFIYNKPPARIYMGDAGSMFLGGFLSAIPLLIEWHKQSFDAYYAAGVVLAVPLLEVFFLIIIRTSIGIPFYKGSPHHFSIYLQKKGWNKAKVLWFTAAMGVLFSLMGILFLFNRISWISLVIMSVGLFSAWCYFVFHKRKIHIPVAKH